MGKGAVGGNPNSVKKKKREIKELSNIEKLGANSKAIANQAMKGLELSNLAAGGGPIVQAIVTTAKIASKIADVYIDYQTSKTGQTLHYGNIKAGKDLITSLGLDYLTGYISNEFFTKNTVIRQNASLEYDRQLYNYNNQGDKFKVR